MSTCPNCKTELDAHKEVANGLDILPEPGDISVCVYCGHICAFDEDLELRDLTDKEIVDIAGDPDLLATQEFGRIFREYKKRIENQENGNDSV
jgi:hypothetical protein